MITIGHEVFAKEMTGVTNFMLSGALWPGFAANWSTSSCLCRRHDHCTCPLSLVLCILCPSPDALKRPLWLVQVNSNYGRPDYTCIYRIRVHGISAVGRAGDSAEDVASSAGSATSGSF